MKEFGDGIEASKLKRDKDLAAGREAILRLIPPEARAQEAKAMENGAARNRAILSEYTGPCQTLSPLF
jgi:hypothetical protein